MTKKTKTKLKISTTLVGLLLLLALLLSLTILFPKLVLAFFGMFFVTMVWSMVKIAKYMDEEVRPYELQSYFFLNNVDVEKILR